MRRPGCGKTGPVPLAAAPVRKRQGPAAARPRQRAGPCGGSVRVLARPGELAVEDTGPGLDPDELERAFDRFYLYSRYGAERPVGTGLGLAIVKELTEGMGGRVQVESEPAVSTRFTVRLQVPARETPAPTPEPAATTP